MSWSAVEEESLAANLPSSLRAAFDGLLDPFVLMAPVRDEQGDCVELRCTYANPAACAYNRLSPEELVGMLSLELLPGMRGTPLMAAFLRVVNTGEPMVMDDVAYVHEGHGQGERRFDIRATRAGDGLAATWRDVTERREAEAALATSEERYRLLAENASDLVCLTGLDGTIRWVARTVKRALGWQPEDLVGTSLVDILHPEDQSWIRGREGSWFESSGGAGQHLGTVVHVRTKAGGYRRMDARTAQIAHRSAQVNAVVVALRDVEDLLSARSQAAAAYESDQQARAFMERAVIGMAIVAPDGALVQVNQAFCNLLERPREALVGRTDAELTHPEDRPASLAALRRLASGETDSYTIMKRYLSGMDESVWVDLSVAAVRDGAGTPVRFVAQTVDLTAERRSLEALAASERLFRLAMASAPMGMAVVDLDGEIVEANPALSRLLGVSLDDLEGRHLTEFVTLEAQSAAVAATSELLSGSRVHEVHEHGLVRGDGGPLWVEHSLSLMRDDDGNPLFFVHQFSDQTESRRLRADLSYRATHDALTGLSNREELVRRLTDTRSARTSPANAPVAVLFCDIDNFKPINDSLGHRAGDAVLVAVAAQLRRAVRGSDFVSRVGGDEFVVVLDRVPDLAEVERIAAKLREAASLPVMVDDVSVSVSLSIGATFAQPEESPDEVIGRADQALYQAKRSGRSRLVVVGAPE